MYVGNKSRKGEQKEGKEMFLYAAYCKLVPHPLKWRGSFHKCTFQLVLCVPNVTD
jgi:hypothetical protein